MQLQNKVYRCVSPSLVHSIFVESLLCSSNICYIQLAGHMVERSEAESNKPSPIIYNMQTRVPYLKSVELILSSAREYFNSAANLTDSCMDLARSCLNLIQDNPESIQEEHDLISSLSVLEDFGVTILPLQVRLCKDRLGLIQKAVDNRSQAYRQTQKLLRLGHLLRVPAIDRTDRDGQILHIIAHAAVKNEDFTFAYEICEELMSTSHGASWDVCVDLAEHVGFQNVKAKVELLSFAVTFCDADMIEPVLQAKALLETQVLYERLSSKVDDDTEDGNKRVSPFSSKAALQQTAQILTSTKQTTKAVLSTITDSKWWQGTVDRLRQPTRQTSYDMTNRNIDLELQSCHPFYDGFIDNCYSNTNEANFRDLEMNIDLELQTSENLLRTAMLEEVLTEGEKSQSITEVLLQLAIDNFSTDCTLSLAYLLALQHPTDADRCFNAHPKTDISLQLAVYYYSLQIYTTLQPGDYSHLSPLYLHEPVKIMKKVLGLVYQCDESDRSENVLDLVRKIKQYNEMLQDYRQAKVLSKLGRGIDTERFASDSEYKMETILGLAMSIEDDIYNISLSLADRYNISPWQLYATHLEFLLCDSGLSVDEIQSRVSKLNILEVLQSKAEKFCERMTTYVYPSIEGTNHQMLMYYYSTMSACDIKLQGNITADSHIKLLKKLRSIASDLDYKRLMCPDVKVVEILSPCLTSSNVATFAKLSKNIPDGSGGFMDPSVIYCTWAVKYFWNGDGKKQPDSSAGWVHRYEACSEYIQKLQAENIIDFLQSVLFNEKSRTVLEDGCRIEICRRMTKFTRQQINKKKKTDLESGKVWEDVNTVVCGYLKHLETLNNPVIVVMSESEVVRVKEYLKIYDLSMGDEKKIHQVLVSIVLEGELSLDAVSEFISALNITMTSLSVLKDAIDFILSSLSKKETSFKPLIDIESLTSLETIVENVQDHIEAGGDIYSSDRLLSQLRPFCSDSMVDVQPRLDVLYILEKRFKLSEEDSVLLTLYRTQAIITEAWAQYKVTEDEINSASSRRKLFFTLLEKTKSTGDKYVGTEFVALCRLLKQWPPFTVDRGQEYPWCCLLLSMIQSGCNSNINLVLGTVRSFNTGLSQQHVESLYDEMLKQNYCLQAVNLVLISSQRKLFSSAMEVLSQQEQIQEDEDFINLLLKHHLVPDLVSTCHYPVIINYILANQDPDIESPDYLSVEGLANQLRGKGYEAEAGCLIMKAKSTPPMLQTFGAALGSLSKWFK
ncbi:hypothetical protein ACF0H5_013708 [Mactra antiquata]